MPSRQAAPEFLRRPEAFALTRAPACDEPVAGAALLARSDLLDAIAAAPTLARLEAMSAALWARWAAGGIDDGQAQALANAAHARRAALKGPAGDARPQRPPASRAAYPPRRKALRPDRAAARERRRRLAASGPMPPVLAARFTTGELAALKIVADEIVARGDCRLSLGEIAARAGVSLTTARNGLRAAAGDGLLAIEERPRRGLPNLTNIVRLLSRDWRVWLRRGARRLQPTQGGGCKKPERTGKESLSEGFAASSDGNSRRTTDDHALSSSLRPWRTRSYSQPKDGHKDERRSSPRMSRPRHAETASPAHIHEATAAKIATFSAWSPHHR